MPYGGKLTIETSNITLKESNCSKLDSMQSGCYVMLAVSDTGHGMDEQTRSHIFEPFYTTKEVGKGTGLGLATVYGIIQQSGGHIEVMSEAGHGASFRIFFPKIGNAAVSVEQPEQSFILQKRTESVLVVEDVDEVREYVCKVLRDNGHIVLEASSGNEAIAYCRQHKQPVSLLLTDVIMPGISCKELAEEIATLLPGIKVLFMSGYTDDAISRNDLLKPDTFFIEKPFSPQMLTQKVQEVLGFSGRFPSAPS
jgi:two-component system, cell cycle sensor histidine kinase and response regulator CckA